MSSIKHKKRKKNKRIMQKAKKNKRFTQKAKKK
jgi:hypothetical protein